MADMLDPAGMLGRGFYKFYKNMSAGDTTLVVTVPFAGNDVYVPILVPSWNTVIELLTFSTGSFTVKFSVPAPAGGQVRGLVFV